MIVIVMGVSGAGKTAVGELLASQLGWVFHDGDDLHPAANVRKMSAGQPLTDDDRRPWLESIRALIHKLEVMGTDAIVACSALKEEYRELLLAGTRDARIVYLRGTPTLIERRLRQRREHYFDVDLLASQFETLEEPKAAVVIDIDADLESVTAAVAQALSLETTGTSKEEGKQ